DVRTAAPAADAGPAMASAAMAAIAPEITSRCMGAPPLPSACVTGGPRPFAADRQGSPKPHACQARGGGAGGLYRVDRIEPLRQAPAVMPVSRSPTLTRPVIRSR